VSCCHTGAIILSILIYFGSCCVDEVAALHVNAEVVIHFGHTCLSLFVSPLYPNTGTLFTLCPAGRQDFLLSTPMAGAKLTLRIAFGL